MRSFRFIVILILAGFPALNAAAQGSEEYGSGIRVNLDESGNKYIRFITWHQFWLRTAENSVGEWRVTPYLRRSRFLAYSQINKRFLVLTHFGINNLFPAGLHPTGQSSEAQMFLHDAWTEYTLVPQKLYVGGGLHYWNGLSRFNSASTLNFMTMDNARFLWANLGTSDQFARHLGVYAKGQIGKIDYRFSWDEALVNSLDAIRKTPLSTEYATYRSHEIFGDRRAGSVYQGYVKYMIKDKESNLLPYAVGSYLGTKKVFNIGFGYYLHPQGTVSIRSDRGPESIGLDTLKTHDVKLLAADLFYDAPIGSNNMALSLYATLMHYDYGPNYRLLNTSNEIATSEIFYTQTGLLLPKFSNKFKLMPYASYSNRHIQAIGKNCQSVGLGTNMFLDGHNAKITLEWSSSSNYIPSIKRHKQTNALTLQLHIYL